MKLVRDSLLQRYTPPTCTLELWQVRPIWQPSPKTLPTDYHFALHFDDPRLAEDQQTTVTGTPSQLEALAQTVEDYVQTQLSRAFCPPPQGTATQRTVPEKPTLPNPLPPEGSNFALTPHSPFSHQLKVVPGDGVMAPSQAIALTTSQLFDLTTALTQFRLQVTASDSSATTDGTWGFWRWSTLALTSLVAISITGAMLRQWQPGNEVVDQEISPLPGQGQFQFQPVMPAIPPPPRPTTASPTLAPPLALRDPLPPPATVVQASPPPRNPNVALVLPPERILPPTLTVPPGPDQTQMTIPASLPLSPLVPPDEPLPQGQTQPMENRQDDNAPSLASPSSLAPPPQVQTTALMSTSRRPLPPQSENLLDTIPQVAEVRQFYQRQWQPEASQSQTLEYRLKISPDGQVQRTVPLGKAASLYLAQLPMPNAGDPLVSPLTHGQTETIRLVLTPMGEVKAFLED